MKDEDAYNLDEVANAQTKKKIFEVKPKIIPPPGTGQKIFEIDPFLQAHRQHLDFR